MLIAADVPAMAPGTRTGAAHPVRFPGTNQEGDVLLKKQASDLAALVRSIAEHRGRNVDKVEKAVLSADSYTDEVALRDGIIDLVAKDRDDLIAKLEGRSVKRFDGTQVTLRTAGAVFVTSERTWQQEFWEALASPTLAFFLLLLGVAGIYTEFTHPGLILPGAVGAFCLLLFFLSAQVLPVSMVGLLLLLLGLVMFILELKVTSHGMLTLGGILSVVLGSVLLFPGPIPELRLPIVVVLPASLTLAAFCALAVRLAVAARRAPVTTGVEGLRGEVGVVTQDLAPEGKVFVHGEIWNAISAGAALPKGTAVRVRTVDNMRLEVEPAPAKDRQGANG
jgi:membrane-bound serine protease (ClpP class)